MPIRIKIVLVNIMLSFYAGHYDKCFTYTNSWDHDTQRLDITLFYFFFRFCFFRTGFLCVTALAVLELALIDQTGLKLTEVRLPQPHECWD